MNKIVSRLFLVIFIFASLFSSSSLHALIGPMRAAKCFFKPTQYSCTPDEIKQAKAWAATVSIAALTAAFSVALILTPKINQRYQAQVQANRQEVMNELEELGFITSQTRPRVAAALIDVVIEARGSSKDINSILEEKGKNLLRGRADEDAYYDSEQFDKINYQSEFGHFLLESRKKKLFNPTSGGGYEE